MKYFYYALIITVITASSCKNSDTEKELTGPRVIVPFTQQNASSFTNQNVQTPVVQKHNLFNENNEVRNPAVNPEHGQPNHRCDIPVGAPLNGVSKSNVPVQQNNVQPTPVTNSIQNPTVKTVTPTGMNPPHGEKGHRCDISVGAPLSSVPVKSEVSKPVSEQVKIEQNVPALLSTSTPEVITPKGMNPPHGEEGHLCEIAVGAPLIKE